MKESSLKDKVIIVTGAASGIGAAVALCFAQCGAKVALLDINISGAKTVLSTLPNKESHIALPCDLGQSEQCTAVVQQVIDWAGQVDVLINAAAYLERKPVSEVDESFMSRTVSINMSGPFFLAQACAEPMKKQGFGRIILFSSQGAFTGGFNGSAVYAMTKAAVIALVKSLAREYATYGITVNSVAPGGVDTPMLRGGMSDKDMQDFIDKIPMERLATPMELAQACKFLASDDATYITGTTLDVNGGQLMR